MTDVYEELRQLVLTQIQRSELDTSDELGVDQLVRAIVDTYQRQATSGRGRRPLHDPVAMVDRLTTSVLRFGPLTPFLDDSVLYEELIIHGDQVSYIDTGGRLVAHPEPVSEAEVHHVVNKLLASVGASVDEGRPVVQAQVLDGRGRLGVVLPPVADRIDVTLRRYVSRRETFEELIEWGALDAAVASLLTAMVMTPTGVLVTGQPGAGKTTLLNAILRSTPPARRIIACEDTPELSVDHLNAARWRTRPSGADGRGAVSLRDLVRTSLGMRPDLIVLGETRGAEAYEVTRAGNAGCGLLTTIHANGARQGLQALLSTAVMAGSNVAVDQVRHVFSSIIDLVVHVGREPGTASSRRQVMEVVAVPPLQGSDVDFTVEPIFVRNEFGAPLQWTGTPLPAELEARLDLALRPQGVRMADLLERRATLT